MKKIWNSIKPIVYSYTAQYIIIFILSIFYIAYQKDNRLLTDDNFIYQFTIITTALSMVPVSIYLYKNYKIKESKINISKLLLMIPLGLSISLFYNMLTITFNKTNSIPDLNIIIVVIYIVLLAPIFEELVFRYVSLRCARENFKEKTAIILISIIFALMHSGIINMVYAFIIGLILSHIYLKHKNILYPITIHISANLMSIFIKDFNLIAMIISIIMLSTCYIILKKHHQQ